MAENTIFRMRSLETALKMFGLKSVPTPKVKRRRPLHDNVGIGTRVFSLLEAVGEHLKDSLSQTAGGERHLSEGAEAPRQECGDLQGFAGNLRSA